MMRVRIIPCLLLKDSYLYKTVKFKKPSYIGDPINAVKIFNEKEVDELIFLDISATVEKKAPPYEMIQNIASECFMPLCYGGGVRHIEAMRKIFQLGVEKVAINSAALENPELIQEAAKIFGSQSIVVAIDVKKDLLGRYQVYGQSGTKKFNHDPVAWAKRVEQLGAGEILVNSIDRDGTLSGYDLALIQRVSAAVSIPVIALGGAGNFSDFNSAIREGGASAVSAGSYFVYHGKHRAVLISYPSPKEIEGLSPMGSMPLEPRAAEGRI